MDENKTDSNQTPQKDKGYKPMSKKQIIIIRSILFVILMVVAICLIYFKK